MNVLLKVIVEASSATSSLSEKTLDRTVRSSGLNDFIIERFHCSQEEQQSYGKSVIITECNGCFRGFIFCPANDLQEAKNTLRRQVKEAVEKYDAQMARSRKGNSNVDH